jgi:hypothetical protein
VLDRGAQDLRARGVPGGGGMAVDAVQRILDMGVEARRQRGALAVVARLIERRAAQVLQAPGDRRRAVDGIAALSAIEGIGRREQRLLLAGDEAVDPELTSLSSESTVHPAKDPDS